MAYVILGLLHLSRMSLYDLVKAFEEGVSLFYGASTGSIKRALDGLLSDGSIAAEGPPGVRGRREYAITDTGRERFREWMIGEVAGDAETAALSRLYFLGLLGEDEREQALTRIRVRLESDLRDLERVRERALAAEIPESWREVAHYQLATLDYGLASHRAALAWFSDVSPQPSFGSATPRSSGGSSRRAGEVDNRRSGR